MGEGGGRVGEGGGRVGAPLKLLIIETNVSKLCNKLLTPPIKFGWQ